MWREKRLWAISAGMATINPATVQYIASAMPRRDLCALVVRLGGHARGAEDADQAEDRAHQAEERSESGHHFEKDETALQPHDFPPRIGLDRVGVFVLRPARVHETGPDEARKRGVFVDRNLLDQRGFAAVSEIVDRPGEGGLDHARSERSERMRSKIIAREMMLQSINGTITYQEKIRVSDQEPNISLENSVSCRGSHSFPHDPITVRS